MAQKLAQKKPTLWHGNTNNVPKRGPLKGRNWCLTLNNYTRLELAQLYDIKLIINLKQFCFQEETGENNTPHIQGVFAFKNAISFNSVKKLSPRAHWERCKSLKASLQYCSKADSRNGKTYTHNYEIFNEGKPLTKIDVSADLLKQALADLKINPMNIKYL